METKHTAMKTKIEKLANPESWGDWHDRPMRWVVRTEFAIGPSELQKFQTKKDALLYARIRRASATEWLALREYASL